MAAGLKCFIFPCRARATIGDNLALETFILPKAAITDFGACKPCAVSGRQLCSISLIFTLPLCIYHI